MVVQPTRHQMWKLVQQQGLVLGRPHPHAHADNAIRLNPQQIDGQVVVIGVHFPAIDHRQGGPAQGLLEDLGPQPKQLVHFGRIEMAIGCRDDMDHDVPLV